MDEHFTQDTFKFFQHLLQNTTTYSPLCGDVLGKGSILSLSQVINTRKIYYRYTPIRGKLLSNLRVVVGFPRDTARFLPHRNADHRCIGDIFFLRKTLTTNQIKKKKTNKKIIYYTH